MPLVRVEVRNEYGLGMPELYTEVDREDPKAVLDGVTVAGLVGILRQLGDLAEFAAEIFHGLQEQVLITSSRSHKLVERVHNIEASLPPLEKAILAQRSHLHFAYTAGSHWHTRLRTEQNHFIYSDLPRCIMDSYEDCRDPPRLHKLDRFDIGGPGSCFKRYSDPTYIKRTSAGPYEAHLQSVPRQKKARRNKKKRSSSKYRDVTYDGPAVMQVGRPDFGSSKFEEKPSPSQDVSMVRVPQKPEIEPQIDHLTSIDSRNGSGYIDCIFRPSYSSQSEDNNAKEPSSDSYLQHTSYFDENIGAHDENVNNNYVAENSRSMSPYITWDEKLEIIDSTGRPNETTEISCTTEMINTEEEKDLHSGVVDETTEISCTTEMINTEEEKDLHSGVVDHIDFDFHDEQPLTTSVIVKNQPDEIESETDFYMDALNTIESESETDIDCHTKRELKQYSSVHENDVEEMHKDDGSMNFEFHIPERSSSSQPKSISPASHMETYVSSTTSDNFKSEEVERPVMNEEIVASSKEPDSQTFPSEQILSTRESPEPSSSTSGGQTTVSNPVMFWTNGGLLGLEPSKPPDFGLATAVGPTPVEETKTDGTQHLDQKNSINGHVTSDETVVNTSKPESSDVNGGPVSNDDPINSSRIFEFSNRLLVNGFRKQISLVGNEKLASSVKSEVPENTSINKGYQTLTGIPFREQFGNRNPLISPSSPPLEHMRISFQPIDGFETSKLKLMFPDGNSNNESNGHMFPSFQLVPEPSTSLHGSGSDSDDDTFCRSSPYASDDCHSNPSESNSEQWDSSDSPRIKDHELDDAFGRISSAESVSSSLVNGIRFPDSGNYAQQNGVLFDIPNFDSLNTSNNQVSNKEPTPPPPPLPPMEWRGNKPHPEDALSDALTCALNLTPPEPPVPRQPKPVPTKQDHVVETVAPVIHRHKQPDWQNLHVQNESKRATNGKVGDDKEDFLQQIRTKSMNLRPTSTARSTNMPTGPNSVKVTAIIEKASAIRQAVGSDDGEDNWSDT